MTNTSIKHLFLQQKLFLGLNDLNSGFDAPSIQYFNEKDFEIILERVEAMDLGIYGIEPWSEGEYFHCLTYESTLFMCTSPKWYRKAFEQLKYMGLSRNKTLQWSASYYVPETALEKFKAKMN